MNNIRFCRLKNFSDALDSVLGERPMWKPEHRIAADRGGLRYPSDLTDAEWMLVEPLIPPAKRGGRYGPAVSGRPYRGTCPRRARCTTIWNCGTGTARWSASIIRSTLRYASRKGVTRAPRWRSSTHRPPKALKKGVLARSFGL